MDFYDRVDAEYLNVITRPLHLWRVKLELLDHNENTIKCIEQDIDYSNAGNITCNNVQGTRKSCSITLINVDLKYIPTEDSPFWFNRKFRLFLGMVDNRHYKNVENDWTNETDVYWFTKGVYITSDIHVDSTAHTVTISGIDKFAQLDGTLNVLQADEMNTVFEYGSPIVNVIQDILSLDMGNGLVLDPVTPIIDTTRLNSVYLYKEFTLSAGQYYGDFLNELATSYGAEVYYDNVGRLNFTRIPNDDFPYWIGFRAPVHEFKSHLTGYQNPQETIKLTGVNKIIVATDNVETPNASYTAINNNPRSPLCFGKIGARTLPENGGVVIINAGNIVDDESQEADPTLVGESEELVTKRCRDYAEYRLMQETCLGTSITFNCPPYLHLNEGDIISITDPDFGLDCDLYIINSITFPLGANELSLEVSNLAFLNSDILSVSQFSTVANQPIRFGIHYLLNGGTGTAPANQLVGIGESFTTATDYDEENHSVSFGKANNELMSWTDNINGSEYDLNTEYTVPNQHFTLTANWANYEDYIMEYRVRDVPEGDYVFHDSVNRQINGTVDTGENLYSTAFLTINDNKFYFYGRDFESVSSLELPVEEDITIKMAWVPYNDSTIISFNGHERDIITSGTNGGQTYYVKYPNAVEDVVLDGTYSYLETLIFPRDIKRLTNNLSGAPTKYTSIDFNNIYEVTVNNISGKLFFSNYLESVVANNHLTVNMPSVNSASFIESHAGTMVLPSVNFAGGLTINNDLSSSYVAYFLYVTGGTPSGTDPINIIVGSVERNDPYMGGLEMTHTQSLCFGNVGSLVNIVLDKLYMNNSAMLTSGGSIGNITLNGNIKLINQSAFLLGVTTLADTGFVLNGDYLYIDSSTFFVGCSAANIVINSNVIIRCTTYSATAFVNTQGCESISFYGEIDIDLNGYAASLFNNGSVTDIYFYNDNFSIINYSSATIFQNVPEGFTIHGIANGNVQAFATANNIPFEVIPNE